VHRVLEGAMASRDRLHFGTQKLHAEDVGLLPLHVRRAHVDNAGKAEACGYGRRGNTVLACTRLGDDTLAAHALCEQNLAEAVVDLVRTGVVQVFALEVDLRSAQMPRQSFGMVELRWATGVMGGKR